MHLTARTHACTFHAPHLHVTLPTLPRRCPHSRCSIHSVCDSPHTHAGAVARSSIIAYSTVTGTRLHAHATRTHASCVLLLLVCSSCCPFCLFQLGWCGVQGRQCEGLCCICIDMLPCDWRRRHHPMITVHGVAPWRQWPPHSDRWMPRARFDGT